MDTLTRIMGLANHLCFTDICRDDTIPGLRANGYALNLTPCKYNYDRYTVMIEIGEIDDSFIPQPKVDNGL